MADTKMASRVLKLKIRQNLWGSVPVIRGFHNKEIWQIWQK